MNHFKINPLLFAFWLGLVTVLNSSCKQELPYQSKEISQGSELNFAFTSQRGIQYKNGIVFYVEEGKQSLSAYQHDKKLWSANIVKAYSGFVVVGEPAIRYMKVHDDMIEVVIGKHCFVSIDIKTGEPEFMGCD